MRQALIKEKIRPALFAPVLGALLLLVGFAGASSANAAKPAPEALTLTGPNNITVGESDDYATQMLGDPWDMNNLDDLDGLHDIVNFGVSNGVWHGTTTTDQGNTVFFQYQNYNNAYSYMGENDGRNHPIDTTRYNKVWIRMYSQDAGNSVLWFFRHLDYTGSGNSDFISVVPGWHIYSVDLRSSAQGGSGTWTQNGPFEGLRLDLPWFNRGNNVQIDWARLTPATSQTTNITWTYSGDAGAHTNLYLSYSATATDDNEYLIANVAANAQQYAWNSTGLAPGTYYIHAEVNGAWSSIGPMTVDTAPLAHIDAPSPLSGEDFAQAKMATLWKGCPQFYRTNNVNQIRCDGVMQGSPTNGDPQTVWLDRNYATTVDTTRYHYVNVRFYLAPPAVRPWASYNAGTRMVWSDGGTTFISLMILAPYSRWIQSAFDMRTVTRTDGGTGWTGNQSTVRFDPNEDDDLYGQPPALPQFFQIDQSHITSDPYSGPATIIRWTALQGDGSVDIYRDNNNSGFDGTLIASNVPLAQGSYPWDTSALGNGNYWIYVVSHDRYSQSKSYSLLPLVVDHSQASTLFSDVPTNFWAVDDINKLAIMGVVSGSKQSDSTMDFNPGGSAARAHLSKMVTLAAGWTLLNPATPTFNDVPANSTFYQYIETAYSHGALSGYNCGAANEPCPGRYFRPANNVTRGQTTKMISLSRGWNLIVPSTPTFADVSASDPLYTYVETASAHSIISGYACGGAGEPCDGQNRPYFRPSNGVTRAQLSKMLARSLQ